MISRVAGARLLVSIRGCNHVRQRCEGEDCRARRLMKRYVAAEQFCKPRWVTFGNN
jgi:hypothetical protein